MNNRRKRLGTTSLKGESVNVSGTHSQDWSQYRRGSQSGDYAPKVLNSHQND